MTTTVPNAYQGEAILKGVTFSSKGGHCIRLEIEPSGWEVLKAMDGAHFAIVMVPVANDGSPDKDKIAKAEKSHRRAQQAGICCEELPFWKFLVERYGAKPSMIQGEWTSDDAARFVRSYCRIQSRRELDTNEDAGRAWAELHSQYQVWKLGL